MRAPPAGPDAELPTSNRDACTLRLVATDVACKTLPAPGLTKDAVAAPTPWGVDAAVPLDSPAVEVKRSIEGPYTQYRQFAKGKEGCRKRDTLTTCPGDTVLDRADDTVAATIANRQSPGCTALPTAEAYNKAPGNVGTKGTTEPVAMGPRANP